MTRARWAWGILLVQTGVLVVLAGGPHGPALPLAVAAAGWGLAALVLRGGWGGRRAPGPVAGPAPARAAAPAAAGGTAAPASARADRPSAGTNAAPAARPARGLGPAAPAPLVRVVRARRHGAVNRLQVALGWLQLGRPERAASALAEWCRQLEWEGAALRHWPEEAAAAYLCWRAACEEAGLEVTWRPPASSGPVAGSRAGPAAARALNGPGRYGPDGAARIVATLEEARRQAEARGARRLWLAWDPAAGQLHWAAEETAGTPSASNPGPAPAAAGPAGSPEPGGNPDSAGAAGSPGGPGRGGGPVAGTGGRWPAPAGIGQAAGAGGAGHGMRAPRSGDEGRPAGAGAPTAQVPPGRAVARGGAAVPAMEAGASGRGREARHDPGRQAAPPAGGAGRPAGA